MYKSLRMTFVCDRHGVDKFFEVKGAPLFDLRVQAAERLVLFMEMLDDLYGCTDVEPVESIETEVKKKRNRLGRI